MSKVAFFSGKVRHSFSHEQEHEQEEKTGCVAHWTESRMKAMTFVAAGNPNCGHSLEA